MSRKLVAVLLAAVFLLAATGVALAAGWANPDLLMTAKEVKKIADKPNWVILDCRKLKDYVKGHIPGAISLGKQCKKALRDTTSRAFRDISKYESLLGKVGIGNEDHVVIYGEHLVSDTMKDTTVAFWLLEYLGHDGKTHVLNGGIDDWINAGYPQDNKPTIRPAATFKARVVHSRLAETDEILSIAKGKKKGVQLIDARSAKENKGSDIRAVRGGKVPNTTINVSHKDTYEKSKDAATGEMVDNGFITPDTVAGFYKDLDRNKRTIAYCQTGTRSTLTYLQLRLLGFRDPANWDESWRVWGSHPAGYPVENEEFYDFTKLKKLEKKVEALEDAKGAK